MSTYRGTAPTGGPNFTDIDHEVISGRIAASAIRGSAFLPFVMLDDRGTDQGPTSRIVRYTQRSSLAFAEHTYESTAGAAQAPTEKAYNPTSRDYTLVTQVCDVEITLYARVDGSMAGQSVVDQVVEEGALGYINHVDAEFAKLYTDASAATPDHEIGSTTSALSGSLIDQAIALLLAAGAPPPYVLCIHTAMLPELMDIPGMREASILGVRNGAVGPPGFGIQNKTIVSNYANILTIVHSDQIQLTDTNTAYASMMWAVGDRARNTTLANPYIRLSNPVRGGTPQKMLVDLDWLSAERTLSVNMTTLEDYGVKVQSATNCTWMVHIKTAV